MTHDSFYVLSTLASANAVGETDVLLIGALLILIDTARQDCRDLPAVRAALIGDSRAILGEQVNILLEGVRWNDLAVPRNLDFLGRERSQFDCACLENLRHIIELEPDKTSKIGLKRDPYKTASSLILVDRRLSAG